jgi:nucleoid-associated protein YgaU
MGVTYEKWSGTPPYDQLAAGQENTHESNSPAASLRQVAQPPAAETQNPLPPTKLASIAPDEPQKSSALPEPPIDDSKPSFDTIRIDRDGLAVVAGRGLPESDITVMLDGEPIGSAKTDREGAWVLVPNDPVPAGDHQLTLRMQTADSLWVDSEQSVALKVPDRAGEDALVVLSDPSRASKVLQKPEVQTANTTVGKISNEPVAAAEPAPKPGAAEKTAASSPELTLGTVDYNDEGDIIFSGTAKPGSSVRLYVDNKPAGDAAATMQGAWSFAGKEEISPGSHSLRVDELRADGSVASRVELPFMRAAPQEVASLAQAQPQEPPADATPSSETALAEEAEVAAIEAEPPEAAPSAMEETAAHETVISKTTPAAAEPVAPAETAQQPQSAPGDAQQAAAQPASTEPSSESAQATASGDPHNGKIVIQPGNSLWRISRVIYGRGVEYTVIYEANKDQIRDPNRIYPGQIFATPGVVPPENIDPQSSTPLASTNDDPTSQQ